MNERVKAINESFSLVVPLGDWICECSNQGCDDRIGLTLPEYEALRSDATRFCVSPDGSHVDLAIEDVVTETDRFWVERPCGRVGNVGRPSGLLRAGIFGLSHRGRLPRLLANDEVALVLLDDVLDVG